MQIFEFVVSLYVVIAGLGVTLLVRNIGQMIESRDRITFYWVQAAVVFGVIAIVVWALGFVGHPIE
jgi:hypothetical protein